MAKGNASLIKDIIDDTKTSTQTTFSSDKLEKLINAGNADIVYLTVSAIAPTITSSTDIYYNSTTKLIYKVDNNAWNVGEAPKANTLYIGTNNKKVYLEDTTGLKEVSGGSSSVKVSTKDGNAITTLENNTDPDEDGIYVEDLSTQVKNINIAQKTVNEDVGYIQVGCSDHTESLVLGSVLKFPYIRDSHNDIDYDSSTGIFKLKAGKTYSLEAQITMFETYGYFYYIFKDITKNKEIGTGGKTEFNTSRSYHDDKGNIASALYTPDADTEIQLVINSTSTGSFKIQGVSYIKITEIGRNIIIDPVNYIDTTQGIQDVPVGQVVEVLGDKELQQYRICNGDTIDIGVYPELEQKFKEMCAVNMFGGDGVTNYKLPNLTPTIYNYISRLPEMTAPNIPTPYVATASSIFDSRYQAYMAFNSNNGDAGYCWHSKGGKPTIWLQIDYGSPVKINAFRLRARSTYSGWLNQMPTSFKLQGSNDGVNFTTIKEYSGLSYGGTKYETEFLLDNDVEYRYYKLTDMVGQGSPSICFNKVEYLYVVKKSSYIKVKPTYFIGTINGYEERKTLMDTPVLIPCTNGMLKPGTEVPLSESLDDYDYVEVHVGADYAGSVFGKHVTRIPTSEIIYSPTKTEWANTYQDWICDQNTSFALWYGFKDAQTLYVGRMQANVNSKPSNYRGCQIIKIIGIRNKYKIN